MAFNFQSRELQMSDALIWTYGDLTQINQAIDAYKKSPSGNVMDIVGPMNEAQKRWQAVKGTFDPSWVKKCELVDITMSRTQTRVDKLVKRFPLATIAQQIADRASKNGFISFYDVNSDSLTSLFGNFHPCKIEFGGKDYQNSESVFQAQKFTDQPSAMAQFETASGDQAVQYAQATRMTTQRLSEWDDLQKPHVNKIDIMMNALRAKFGQNSELKEALLATGSVYLVEHLPDPNRRDRFWSDGYDGTGGNNLGICLMRLRQEYGGSGIVAQSIQYVDMLKKQNSSHRSFQYPTTSPATPYVGQSYSSRSPAPLHGRCIQCQQKPKYVEAGQVHDYCGKACAIAAGALSQ